MKKIILPSNFLEFKKHILQGLMDDGYSMDWTSLGTSFLENKKSVKAEIIAKSRGVFFGEELARAVEAMSQEIGCPIRVLSKKKDGDELKKGDVAWALEGQARSILVLERPFLNIGSYLGGIATRTRGLVELVEREAKKRKIKAPRVTSTRKTLPHYRDLSVTAVMAGGGYPHRVTLSGGVLIKENHIRAAGGIKGAIEGVRAVSPHGLKIEIEVTNLDELNQALNAHAEVVMLDNFSLSLVKKALGVIQKSGQTPLIEVSGGVREENIQDYVLPGVDLISVGGLTHSVKALDLSLLIRN